jgi:hypothetical protein
MPNIAYINMTRKSRSPIFTSAGKEMARANKSVLMPLAPFTNLNTLPTRMTRTTLKTVGGIESIFGDVSKGTLFDSPQGFLGTAIKTINTYNNAKSLSKDGVARELGQIISSPAAIGGIVNTIGGIAGSVFPRNVPSGDTVVASARKFFGG